MSYEFKRFNELNDIAEEIVRDVDGRGLSAGEQSTVLWLAVEAVTLVKAVETMKRAESKGLF